LEYVVKLQLMLIVIFRFTWRQFGCSCKQWKCQCTDLSAWVSEHQC